MPADPRDTLWRVIGLVGLWFCGAIVLLMTGAHIVSTTIEWVKS